MGKKTKKFFDKKKSATYHLMARDSSDPNYSSGPSGDRVFVRVDNNQSVSDSIFADAPEDYGDEYDAVEGGVYDYEASELPENVRREILELGFPDDGYNYLNHMREIKNTGGGSVFYENPKANAHQLPRDIKAYDASRVDVSTTSDVPDGKFISSVASKTIGVKLQKVVDPDVAALLDDSDTSRFGSDVEDLEEDFVIKANQVEEPVDGEFDEKLSLGGSSRVDHLQNGLSCSSGALQDGAHIPGLDSVQHRARRPLDEQFDMLELQEYGMDSEEEEYNYSMHEEYGHEETLAEKLNHAFKDHPSDLLHDGKEEKDIESPEVAPDVIRRCKEYAEKYENEDDDAEEVLFEESSDESEVWDCETIITTYSTLDNHPGIIGAPGNRKPKKKVEAAPGVSATPAGLIALKGKERLPVDYLPRSKKLVGEKTNEKDANNKQTELPKRKPRGQESKEEKKERKSAVKAEKREARLMKKEMRGLYKSESQRAQKVAAFTGPSSIHLM